MKRIVPASSLFAAQRAAGGSPPADVAPTNIAVPTVSGTAQVGSVLTATTGTWTGTSPITYAYQWQRGTSPISGATNATYTVVSGDLSNTLRVVVTATNVAGSASANSANTATVVNPPASPVNTVAPVVSGTAAEGFQLTVSNGTWTGDTPITFTYQWIRGASNIAGATANTYTLVSADVGQQIRCHVTATNAAGSASANSNQTGAVAAAAITINTPVSPQPPASPVVVSGTYVGNMTTAATLVWRNGGVDVGSPITIPTVSGGNWTATITSPAAGTYTLRAVHNLGPTATSSNVTVEAGAAQTIANVVFDGSGDGADTVAVFGHSFPEGAFPEAAPLLVRRTDTDAELRTQHAVLTQWPDGSAKTISAAVEIPALADGVTLACRLRAGEAHSSPGANLSWATLLSGRPIEIKTWAPGNTVTPLWTYDVAAAILASSDDWMAGTLALSRRVEIDVPITATNAPAGGNGPTSLRLVVDVTATKDGMIEVDVAWRNDAVHLAGGGPARFGYTIEVDSAIIYDQRPASGAAVDLLQYNWWMRRRAKKGATVYNYLDVYRPLFRPDAATLINSAFLLPYQTDLAPSASWQASLSNISVTDVAQGTNPYHAWNLARQQSSVGGRPEIGYLTTPQVQWLVLPNANNRRAQLVCHLQSEAIAIAGCQFRDPENNGPVHRDRWPRAQLPGGAQAAGSDSGIQDRLNALGIPTGQGRQNNTTDHISGEQAHRGNHYAPTALLSARRNIYDLTAWRAAEASMTVARFNGVDYRVGEGGPDYTTLTPNHETGVAWGPLPGQNQERSIGWQVRDNVLADYILPSTYPRRSFYSQNAQAYLATVNSTVPILATKHGTDVFGFYPSQNGNRYTSTYMHSFWGYGLTTAVRAGLGAGAQLAAFEASMIWRARAVDAGDGLGRQVFRGRDVNMAAPSPANYLGSWAAVVAENSGIPADWSGEIDDGSDYYWNHLNCLALAAYYGNALDLRATARDSFIKNRSERRRANGNPYNQPTDLPSAANWQTNGVFVPGWTLAWSSAPTLIVPATMNAEIDVPAGTAIGLVDWTGPVPRCTTAEGTNHDAFEIVSQPAGNPFTVSRGGVIRRSATGTLALGNQTLSVRARTISGSAPRGDTEVSYWSDPVTVTVNGTATAPVLSATQSVSIAENATVGTVVATYTYTGTTATAVDITGGNAGSHFTAHLVAGKQVEIRVANTLPAAGATRALTFTVTNAAGTSAAATCNITVAAPVFAPVWVSTTGSVNVNNNVSSGHVVETLTYTGSAATPTIQSGNTDSLFTVADGGTGLVEVRTAAALTTFDGQNRALEIRIANVAGNATITRTVNIVVPTIAHFASTEAPTAVMLGMISMWRVIVAGYAGPLFRVRRTDTNAETDVFAVATTIGSQPDWAAVESWYGGATSNVEVRVVRVYDQLGVSAHDLIQTSVSNQPEFKRANIARYTTAGKQAMRFWPPSWMRTAGVVAIGGSRAVHAVACFGGVDGAGGAGDRTLASFTETTGNIDRLSAQFMSGDVNVRGRRRLSAFNNAQLNGVISGTTPAAYAARSDTDGGTADGLRMFLNDSQIASGTAVATRLGERDGGYNTGFAVGSEALGTEDQGNRPGRLTEAVWMHSPTIAHTAALVAKLRADNEA
jgi:hypothetical protein